MTENSDVFSNSGNIENVNVEEKIYDNIQHLQDISVDDNNINNDVKSNPQGNNNLESGLTYDENAGFNNTLKFSKGIKQKETEWKRYKNWEESSPLICNLFYFFYFPFICRIAPIHEEDIPQISDKDKSKLNIDAFRSKWEPAVKEYNEKMAEYERKQKINKKYVLFFYSERIRKVIYIYIL